MKAKADNIRCQFTESGKQEIVLRLTSKEDISDLKAVIDRGKELAVEVKQYRPRRSLDANAYCWVLCQKIAESIMQTPENVYRKFIHEVGAKVSYYPIEDNEVDSFIATWGKLGIGWFAEVAWDSKLEGYTTVKAYWGSSSFDTKQMSILIDEIVTECKELGIETMTPAEIESLKSQWEGG